jgi:Family of unknown function (DUF5678)
MSPEARIKALRDAQPGSWLAFSEDESSVVAHGTTYEEVVDAAEKAGEPNPVITMVPNDWHERVFKTSR